jgi:hypothetical protein
MAYIGKQPTVGNFVKLDSITTSATTTFNLTNGGVAYSPQSANNCIVSLNGVIQSPNTSFTISGSTIVFASALTSSDVIDFILVLGDVLNIGTPSDATVGFSKITSNLITGATAETSIAGGDSLLIYDDSASALRKMTRTNFVSGISNTPYFYARRGTAQTISNDTITVLVYDDEVFDSNSLYSTSTGRFTVTSTTTGYYFFSANFRANNFTSSRQFIQIRKNGTTIIDSEDGNSGSYTSVTANIIVNLASDGDYVDVTGYHNAGFNVDIFGANQLGNFFGFKLI